jgi:predicted ATPase
MENLPIAEEMHLIAQKNRYNTTVFILPPWQEIYKTDTERKQTWDEALHTYQKMKAVYANYGYQLIEVPKSNIKDRCQYVLRHIANEVHS